MNKTDVTILLILKFITPVVIVLIIFIGLIKSCTTEKVDPLDDSYLKNTENITEINAVDTSGNGFSLSYVSSGPVTKERADEIRSRSHIYESLEKLRIDAPLHFGNMLYTDIYTFASFVKTYDPDKDIKIGMIFVTGYDKIALYEAPNPKIPNYANRINRITLQGNQYIISSDIYQTNLPYKKTYRYWKCSVMNSTSSEDERFIHFSKDEELE